MWLRAPGKRQVRAIPFRVAGPNPSNLPPLTIKVAAQLAGNIDDTTASSYFARPSLMANPWNTISHECCPATAGFIMTAAKTCAHTLSAVLNG